MAPRTMIALSIIRFPFSGSETPPLTHDLPVTMVVPNVRF